MSFLLNKCMELDYSKLIAVNGGCLGNNGIFIISSGSATGQKPNTTGISVSPVYSGSTGPSYQAAYKTPIKPQVIADPWYPVGFAPDLKIDSLGSNQKK